MTLTFREGANGSRPSDAVCAEVPIVDDSDLEGTERLTFRIEAVDQDRITVYESLAKKVLYILDNDGTIHVALLLLAALDLCMSYSIDRDLDMAVKHHTIGRHGIFSSTMVVNWTIFAFF